MCQNISTKSTTPGGKFHVVARSSNQLVIYVDVCAYLLVVTTLNHPRHTHTPHTWARTHSEHHRHHTHMTIHSSEWLMGSLCWATEYIGNLILLVAGLRLVYGSLEVALLLRINPGEFGLQYLFKLQRKNWMRTARCLVGKGFMFTILGAWKLFKLV